MPLWGCMVLLLCAFSMDCRLYGCAIIVKTKKLGDASSIRPSSPLFLLIAAYNYNCSARSRSLAPNPSTSAAILNTSICSCVHGRPGLRKLAFMSCVSCVRSARSATSVFGSDMHTRILFRSM